jgi:(1->4)-alpha-D-glucan 1-alpha-D-glucosylmutase
MLATATHDHKRGEDSRARIAVLSGVPELWADCIRRWNILAENHGCDIHRADRYQMFQTLLGAWPDEGTSLAFVERILAWQQKSLREARLRSSWEEPDLDYEKRAARLVNQLLADPGFTGDMTRFIVHINPAARTNSLVQTALKFCLPGVPDIYQGCELADLSLVDPDNRRAVDYQRRRALLTARDVGVDAKLQLIERLLAMRRANSDLFSSGSYEPVLVEGPQAGHVLAFTRTHVEARLTFAVLIRGAEPMTALGHLPSATWWQDTLLLLDEPVLAHQIFARDPFLIKLDKPSK